MQNFGNIMKQAKKMQERMLQLQEELAAKTVEATAGGGMVSVTVNGKFEVLSLKIEKEVVNPDDVEMLQDLIIAAVNEGVRKAQEMAAAEMAKITGRDADPRPDVGGAMSGYALPIQRLIKELSRFPGIGEKTAARLANHILRASEEDARRLAESILDVKQKIRLCSVCFNLAEGEICDDLRRPGPEPGGHLRRRGARFADRPGGERRIPRGLPRPPRGAFPARRDRSGTAPDPRTPRTGSRPTPSKR